MPTVSRFPTKALLSQLNKREKMENKGGGNSDDRSPAVIAGLVIAALTLLFAILSYQRSRSGRSMCSLSPLKFVNACPPLFLMFTHINIFLAVGSVATSSHNPSPGTTTTTPLGAPVDGSQVIVRIYHGFSNERFAGGHSGTFSDLRNSMSRGYLRVDIVDRHRSQEG